MPIRVETEGLSEEQACLLIQYAKAAHRIGIDEADKAAWIAFVQARDALIAQGVYAGYSDEDECYTYLYG